MQAGGDGGGSGGARTARAEPRVRHTRMNGSQMMGSHKIWARGSPWAQVMLLHARPAFTAPHACRGGGGGSRAGFMVQRCAAQLRACF